LFNKKCHQLIGGYGPGFIDIYALKTIREICSNVGARPWELKQILVARGQTQACNLKVGMEFVKAFFDCLLQNAFVEGVEDCALGN
jgi:hypothetical protein